MDEFGECIAETLQRLHDEKQKPRRSIEALESRYPDGRNQPCVQGLDTAGTKTPRFKKISLVPTEPAD